MPERRRKGESVTSDDTSVYAGFVVTTGIVLALIIGFVDLSISIVSHSRVLSAFPELLLPLAVTTTAAFLAYVIVCYVFILPVGRRFKLSQSSLLVAFVLFAATLFLLISLFGFRLSPTNAFRYMMLLLVSMLVSVGGYSLSEILRDSEQETRSGNIFLASPWVAALSMIFLWVQVLHIRTPLSAVSLFLTVAFFLANLTLVVWLARMRSTSFARRSVFVLLTLVILSPLVSTVAARRARPTVGSETNTHTVKHVILIVVDTLRPDALSCYGTDNAPTPNIDRLATDGVLFTDAVSTAPWTLPAMASIMSGVSPSVHLAVDYRSAVHDSIRMLAEYMQADGYLTTAIGHNPMLGPTYNLAQGFQEFNWFPRPADDISLGKTILRGLFPETYRTSVETVDLSDLAIDWLEAHNEEDWFLWLHYYDPHHPYSPPTQYLPALPPPASMGLRFSDRKLVQSGHLSPTAEERQWIRELYLSEVRYVDDQIGRVIGTLKRLGIYDESLIVVTSDHGEEFWEHDGFEHGHTLYSELLSVPLIIKLPGQAAQVRLNTLVSTQSLAPTVLDICQVPYDSHFLDTGTLSPLWGTNPDEFQARPVLSSSLLYFEQKESVTFEQSKYIRSRVTHREEFYDRMTDPGEQNRIIPPVPEPTERAKLLLDEHYLFAEDARDYYRIRFDQDADLDKETVERLKALGYM